MSNIIAFPRGKKDSPPITMEELNAKVSETRREHIEYLLDETLSFVFSRCYDEGFDLGQEECVKSTALIVEALRAGLLNTVGIEHPLHDVADMMFVEDNNDVNLEVKTPEE